MGYQLPEEFLRQHRKGRQETLVRSWVFVGVVVASIVAAYTIWDSNSNSYDFALSPLPWLIVAAVLTCSWLALMWHARADQKLLELEYRYGNTCSAQIVNFAHKSGRDDGEYITIEVDGLDSKVLMPFGELLVPRIHMKCIRPGATLVLQVSATNPERKRIDWMATERFQAEKLAKANGYTVVYCAHCGAPLRPESAAKSTPCDYCGELNIPVKG